MDKTVPQPNYIIYLLQRKLVSYDNVILGAINYLLTKFFSIRDSLPQSVNKYSPSKLNYFILGFRVLEDCHGVRYIKDKFEEQAVWLTVHEGNNICGVLRLLFKFQTHETLDIMNYMPK